MLVLICDLPRIYEISNSSIVSDPEGANTPEISISFPFKNTQLTYQIPIQNQIFTPKINNLKLFTLPLKFKNSSLNYDVTQGVPALSNSTVLVSSNSLNFTREISCVQHVAGFCQRTYGNLRRQIRFQDHFSGSCAGCAVTNFEIQGGAFTESFAFKGVVVGVFAIFNVSLAGWIFFGKKKK
ncbi:hypothetical protein SS50377_25216 [Spironucleus salmonicida]|uniref:Transmembrane protein n=1 Tax=Spironucleus salmonicida TaxID=348837 RepID=A0A9P8LRU1_9EUKA|nr:hypothetical protein SS50377_25216 [Spironucleus salmonicida]